MLSVESIWTVFKKETLAVSVMREHLETGAVKENEHNRPLQLEERRPRLTEASLIEIKVPEEKALSGFKGRKE